MLSTKYLYRNWNLQYSNDNYTNYTTKPAQLNYIKGLVKKCADLQAYMLSTSVSSFLHVMSALKYNILYMWR